MVDRETRQRIINGFAGTIEEILEEMVHHGEVSTIDDDFIRVCNTDVEGTYTMYFMLTRPDENGTQEMIHCFTTQE